MLDQNKIPNPPDPIEGTPEIKDEKQPRMPHLWEALLSFFIVLFSPYDVHLLVAAKAVGCIVQVVIRAA